MKDNSENFVKELFMPFGPPPTFPDIEAELKEYIECPDKLPIHQLDNIQCYWPREPDVLGILSFNLAPVGASIKFKRNPITAEVGNLIETDLHGTGETARNSMSMTRRPGPPSEGVRGNTNNFIFWPGGFDEPEKSVYTMITDMDFGNNLRTLARCFKSGIRFKSDNCTPFTTEIGDVLQQTSKESEVMNDTINLIDVINKEANLLGLWSNNRIETQPEEIRKETSVVLSLAFNDKVIDSPLNLKSPVLEISEPARSLSEEWAEQLDVSVDVTDFDKKVPDPAMKFMYKLDDFQKQAITKLEENCNIFVSAHTSAGKTTVAEYAIALSQRHMTRSIYTSPIKALSNQKFREFREKFENVGLITGDLQINQSASCLIMTTEILKSMLYCASEVLRDLEYVIFDEVHYINNEDRGHVWEEVLILLPSNVNIVMLSATVPNPLKFANWVGQIKKRKMYVISTVERPVPLQHYLYLGMNMKTKDNCFLIIDRNGILLKDSYRSANNLRKLEEEKKTVVTKTFAGSKKQKKISLESESSILEFETEKKKPHMISQKERSMWIAFLKYIQEQEKLPVVVFALSRNRCDKTADSLQYHNVQLISSAQKEEVKAFFKKSIRRLKGSDAQLPQVLKMRNLLEHGIGVHHSGILPILKEIVELLFQMGFVKMLFATETFAMGINMPARTVVFDSITKYDGSKSRQLYPTEYIQMAGRAGRRGHDTTGTVIIICKESLPELDDLQKMMCGEPQSLKSQFKITYSMVLHLKRLNEDHVSVKDMMRRSFKEVNTLLNEKKIKLFLEEIEEKLSKTALPSLYQQELGEFYEVASKYLNKWAFLRPHMLVTKKADKNLVEGRVLLVSCKNHYNKLAILLEVGRRKLEMTYRVLMLKDADEEIRIEESEKWYNMIALTKKKLFLPSSIPSHIILNIDNTNILEITSCSIKTEYRSIIMDWEKRQIPRFKNSPPGPTVNTAVQELLKLSLEAASNPEVLHPFTEMVINDINLKSEEGMLKCLKQKLENLPIIQAHDFEEQFLKIYQQKELEEEKRKLLLQLSDENLRDYPDYSDRVDILKLLRYIDQDERVTLKGKVALEMGTHELFLTELVLKNILNDWKPAEIAAILSAIVFQQRVEEETDLPPRFEELKRKVEEEYRSLVETERKYNVTPLPALNFGLVNVVYQWARAESFANIMKLTDVQEGIIVRCIQQLNEIIRDVKNAAILIGNPTLRGKMEEASNAIKRDIVFIASLYTQD